MKALRLLFCFGLTASACSHAPTYYADLMDVDGDLEIDEAVDTCAEALKNSKADTPVRVSAARTLGRLQRDRPVAVKALATAINGRNPSELRAAAAWALGELRSSQSLPPLVLTLRTRMSQNTAARVLEAIAKHRAVMAKSEDTLVEVVEGLVFYAGNAQSDLHPLYDLLGSLTRTVPVNIRVLDKAVRSASSNLKQSERAAIYNATWELFEGVSRSRDEILAGPARWKSRLDGMSRTARSAARLDDVPTTLLVLWQLGRLSADAEMAGPAAAALLDAKALPLSQDDRVAVRLVATWALARMQVHALGPRQALLLDILSQEIEPEILRLLESVSSKPGTFDAAQRILGQGS